MTDILPPAGWPNVRQLETNEFAAGGANGNMNEQAKSLAARSELLKQYAALPYESKTGGSALNERVQLATGDIMRSTIASHVNNPNVNMTGWVNVAAWSSIESKPTTVAGFGITDAYTKTEVDNAIASAIPPETPNATETVAGKAKIATTAIAQAGTNDTDIITALKLKNSVFGLGQTWQTVTRSKGVTYTNTSGKLIIVFAQFTSGTFNHEVSLTVNGVLVDYLQMSGTAGATTLTKQLSVRGEVPAGGSYIFNSDHNSVSIVFSSELK